MSYELRNFTNDEVPLWTGPPSPEREQRWHDLLQGKQAGDIRTICRVQKLNLRLGIDIRVTEEDIEKLGRKENAVKLSDEKGGYAVLVNVYHELHCIVSAAPSPPTRRSSRTWVR